MGLITKLFGTYSERELKSIYPIVDKIEAMADEYRALTDEELRAKTPEFKARLANGETLDDILPEAFAAVREAAGRVLGHAALPRAAHRRHRAPSGAHRRDEDRRGQNARRHAPRLPQRAHRARACTSSP